MDTADPFQVTMCILCNAESLRLLVVPLPSLSNTDLAESIRVAREAAMQLVLDTADAWADADPEEEPRPTAEQDSYISYVVERAEDDGIIAASEVREWRDIGSRGDLLQDPRVQAFLSSAAEGLALYITQIRDKRSVLERFLEVPNGATPFGGIGASGEVFFHHDEDRFTILTEEEAMQIAIDHIAGDLWKEDPARLLRYSSLPDEGISLLTSAQQGPQDRANEILAGIIDLPLLAEDMVRQSGYGRFIADGATEEFTEQRFGDFVILRLRVSEDVEEGSF
jgi:hypothetical protein